MRAFCTDPFKESESPRYWFIIKVKFATKTGSQSLNNLIIFVNKVNQACCIYEYNNLFYKLCPDVEPKAPTEISYDEYKSTMQQWFEDSIVSDKALQEATGMQEPNIHDAFLANWPGLHEIDIGQAMSKGNTSIAEKLIKEGKAGDLNVIIKGGKTPLINAIENGNATMVKLLLDADADANKPDEYGTPLTYAIEKSNIQIVQLLLDHQADPNTPDVFGRKPLELAVMHESEPMVRLLLSAGAKLDKDSACLARPIEHDNERMVELLLRAGANPNVPGSYPPCKPLMIARERHNQKIIDLLRKFGATE